MPRKSASPLPGFLQERGVHRFAFYFLTQEASSPDDSAVFLSDEERRTLAVLKQQATARRWKAWLLGRIAAKEAVSTWCNRFMGHTPPLHTFSLLNDARGKPYLSGSLGFLGVSLTHVYPSACAIVSLTPIGIDMEPLSRNISPSAFLDLAFTPSEGKWAKEDWPRRALFLWTAKEAAAKALGTGLQGCPKRFQALPLAQDKAEVHTPEGICMVEGGAFNKHMIAVAIPR